MREELDLETSRMLSNIVSYQLWRQEFPDMGEAPLVAHSGRITDTLPWRDNIVVYYETGGEVNNVAVPPDMFSGLDPSLPITGLQINLVPSPDGHRALSPISISPWEDPKIG